jgi:cation diffusion facilitator CzcD-associated flavoprotein CzcO
MSQDWNAAWRQQILPTLAEETWDLIVIGGGISGAGILREAARRGWRCLLLEQRDLPGAPPADPRKWFMAVCVTSPKASGA